MQYGGRKALLRYCVEKRHVHGFMFISVVITQLQVRILEHGEPIFLQ